MRLADLLLGLLGSAAFLAPAFGQEPAPHSKPPTKPPTQAYSTPAFETYFPDDAQGGRALDAFWTQRNRRTPHAGRDLAIVRKGLRRTTVPRASILRWVGNKFIWEKNPQHPEAIQIMLHAADPRPSAEVYRTRHNAVYFGLSVIRPKPQPILQALAEVCMASESSDTIGRAVWGCRDQKQAWLACFDPWVASSDPALASKAQAMVRIANGELTPVEWARGWQKEKALAAFRDQVPQWRELLLQGDSGARVRLLQHLLENGGEAALDLDFLPALDACRKDPAPMVRRLATQACGQRFCSPSSPTPPAASAWLWQASHDNDPTVRLAAVQHGFAQMQNLSPEVLTRLLELARTQPSGDLARQVHRSLTRHRSAALDLLEAWILGEDPERAQWAFAYFERFANRPPKVRPRGPADWKDLAGVWNLVVSLGPQGGVREAPLTLQVNAKDGELPRLSGTLGAAPLEDVAWGRDGMSITIAFDVELVGQTHAVSGHWNGSTFRGHARVRGEGLLLFWEAERMH